MSKKMLFILLITLLFFVIAGRCFADVVAQFKQAQIYIKNVQYEQAEQIYHQVLANHPGTYDALKAQKNLICFYIITDNQTQANAALGQLLANFAEHERLPHTIHEITEKCHESGKANKVRELYQHLLANQPNSAQAIWLQMGLAISNILLENDTGAWAETGKLVVNFSADERCAEAVGLVAWSYRKLKQYENARTLYQHVANNWPDRPRAIFSQRGIVLTSIALGDDTTAKAATQKLLRQFSQDEHMPEVVSKIGDTYLDLEKYEKARELHQYVLDNHPDSEEAIFSQRGVILSSIGLGDDANTEAGIEKLLMQFSSNKLIAKMVYQVAGELNNKNDQKAQELYEYVIDKYSSSEFVPLAWVNIGDIKLQLGDDKAARVIFDKVLADFAGHPVLPRAVDLMAYGYYRKALLKDKKGFDEQANWYYQKTITECERIITQLPETLYTTAEACYFSAVCYGRLGQYEKAIEYYQKVVDNWPEYKYAWLAQSKVAKTYKWFLRFGVMSESEAEAAITVTFEHLVNKFPDCPASSAARKWLNYYHKKSSEGRQE